MAFSWGSNFFPEDGHPAMAECEFAGPDQPGRISNRDNSFTWNPDSWATEWPPGLHVQTCFNEYALHT